MISINFNNIPSRGDFHRVGCHDPFGTDGFLLCGGFSFK